MAPRVGRSTGWPLDYNTMHCLVPFHDYLQLVFRPMLHLLLPQAKKLSSEVADLFRNVLRLHLKMNRSRIAGRSRSSSSSSSTPEGLGSEAEDESLEAAELTESSPQQLSYWIAHAFTVSLGWSCSASMAWCTTISLIMRESRSRHRCCAFAWLTRSLLHEPRNAQGHVGTA